MISNWLRVDVAGGLGALLNLLEETGTEIQKKRIFGTTLRVFVWGKEMRRERFFISPGLSRAPMGSLCPRVADLFSLTFQTLSFTFPSILLYLPKEPLCSRVADLFSLPSQAFSFTFPRSLLYLPKLSLHPQALLVIKDRYFLL